MQRRMAEVFKKKAAIGNQETGVVYHLEKNSGIFVRKERYVSSTIWPKFPFCRAALDKTGF